MNKLIFLLLPIVAFAQFDVVGMAGRYRSDVATDFTLTGTTIDQWAASGGTVAVTLVASGLTDPEYIAAGPYID